MRPEVALKIDIEASACTTVEEVTKIRDKWIEEYEKIAQSDMQRKELCEKLIERIKRAAKICIQRYTSTTSSIINSGAHDDSYYEWLEEVNAEEEASLDGGFPLGNSYDADFATPYFTIEQLARIQCGEVYSIQTGNYVEPAYDVLVRKGFLAELMEDWVEAEHCYGGVSTSKSVQQREFDCRRKKLAEGEKLYKKVQEYMASGKWSEIYPYLSRAVEMENTNAITDMALGRIYGTFGIPIDTKEGLRLLRYAARLGGVRACFEIVELHDSGLSDIEGDEAKEMCEKAAKLGHKKAQVRLEDGFDVRPLAIILEERVENGDINAMWTLAQYLESIECYKDAHMWYEKAVEVGQEDALRWIAKKEKDKENES